MEKFDPKSIRKIGVYTSGGDAPGMNAAIRAVVRTALYNNIQVCGIYHGYRGMLEENFADLNLGSMANIIQRGGTILKTGRCLEFLEPEMRARAAENLKKNNIDALVCIGGDGSFRGALALWKEHQVPITGVPGTIDNDINGSEYTVGFDTAVNTALDAIDRIRDTATSHDRLFIVEVMGRNTGYIALEVGLAGGAEEVFFPENSFDVDKVVQRIQASMNRGKKSSILVTAEGPKSGCAYEMAQQIQDKSGFKSKVCILGHVQRGGSPTALDRMIASRFGAQAVGLLLKGECNAMIGLQGTNYVPIPFDTAVQKKPFTYQGLLDLVYILSQ